MSRFEDARQLGSLAAERAARSIAFETKQKLAELPTTDAERDAIRRKVAELLMEDD